MTEPRQILEEASSVLVVGSPSADIPDTLVRAGFSVIVQTAETEYVARELAGDEIAQHPVEIPAKLDLVYVHGSVQDLPGIVLIARTLGASALWLQSGRTEGGTSDPKGCWLPKDEESQARQIVEAAGLGYVGDVYIGDAIREYAIIK
jgi:predicted CoA-binding protein